MKLSQCLLMVLVVLSAVACGKIPDAYQGNFEDTTQGASISLSGNGGVFTTSDGRKLESDATDLSFENLQEGKTGIYVNANSQDNKLLDIFWIAPNIASKQEGGGMVWFQSEVIYTLMDSKKENAVPNIEFFHCKDGTVMLDISTQKFQLGCPANPLHYNMLRKKEK